MIKKLFGGIIIVTLLSAGGIFINMIHQSNIEKPYNCKVLETYFEGAGYKISARYTAVVKVIDINKITSIELTPENFYNAEQFKRTGETVGYYFSNIQMKELKTGEEDNSFNYFAAALFSGLLLFLAYLFIFCKED